MANFCSQCSVLVFGEDYEDMKNLCTLDQNKNNLYSCVLCEHCGSTLVNHLGECIDHTHTHEKGKLFHKDPVK